MAGLAKRRIEAAALAFLAAPMLVGATGRLTSLDERLLAAHNRERAAVGVPALEWDAALAADAAAWGETLAAEGAFEHEETDPDDPDPQGENLWTGTAGGFTPEQMVGLWIAEKKVFRQAPIPLSSATGRFDDVGHYTQLVWRDTDRVGCALASREEEEVLVCRYRTAGNVEGERPF